MKKYCSHIIFILVALSFAGCEKSNTKCCDCLEKEGKSDAYEYPLVPGSEEWKNLSSHTAMVEVCQIPERTLRYICTFGLIETYYNYPLMFVVTAFNNTKEGMQQMFNEFNGAHELQDRPDAATKLMDKYMQLDPSDLDTTWTLLEQGNFLFRFTYMEFTLAYDPILKNLTEYQQSQLIDIAVNKLNEKMKIYPSNWKIMTSFFLITNLLNELQYEPFLTFVNKQPLMINFIRGYLVNWNYLSANEHAEVINIVNNYLTGVSIFTKNRKFSIDLYYQIYIHPTSFYYYDRDVVSYKLNFHY